MWELQHPLRAVPHWLHAFQARFRSRMRIMDLGPPARCQLLPTFLVGRVPLLK